MGTCRCCVRIFLQSSVISPHVARNCSRSAQGTLTRIFSISEVVKATNAILSCDRRARRSYARSGRRKALCEILRIFHCVPAADETAKRRPIGLAKLRQRILRNLRFGLAFPSRDNHAPVRRRKEIASAMPVPCRGLHVS